MLKKYKPICSNVSSKDFEVIQDTSIVDKADQKIKQSDSPAKIQNTTSRKRKSVNVKPTVTAHESDKDEEKEEEEDEEIDETPNVTDEEEESDVKKPKAAWVDEDDDMTLEDAMNSRTFKKNRTVRNIDKNENYSEYLKKKFTSRNPRPKWADPKPEVKSDDEDQDDEDDDLIKQGGDFIQKRGDRSLGTNYLSFHRLLDINKETRGDEGKVVTAVEFHPSIQVALVGGQAGVLSLFQITGGVQNPKLAQVKAEAFPIRVAHFSSDIEILAGSDKCPDMFIYNMETGDATKTRIRYQDNIKNFRMSPDYKSFAVCGENGSIRLYSSRTKEFSQNFKMNGTVNDVVFAPNGTTLYSTGGTGEIYEWDTRSSLPVRKFLDDGCVKGTRLAVSPDGKLLATGSNSGVVNIYHLPITSYQPTPDKILLHLTTGVTDLSFNHTSEILAFSSLDKNAAVKLYNVKSRNVFCNFPDAKMGERTCRPNALAFSPHSGFFAFTNNDKSAFLFRLNHYKNY
ncbi:hypothetical protein M8J77_021507 [Diaphorina citri]|nr:hypothetical protein M8J77_021507 [Diaphorina citri]